MNICNYSVATIPRGFSQEELKEAVDKVDKNSEQDFGIEELIAIAVYDSEGCRYYTDDLSKAFSALYIV